MAVGRKQSLAIGCNELSKPDRSEQRRDAYALEIAPAVKAAQAAGSGQTYGALAAALNDRGILR